MGRDFGGGRFPARAFGSGKGYKKRKKPDSPGESRGRRGFFLRGDKSRKKVPRKKDSEKSTGEGMTSSLPTVEKGRMPDVKKSKDLEYKSSEVRKRSVKGRSTGTPTRTSWRDCSETKKKW